MNLARHSSIICIVLESKATRGLQTRLEESDFGCALIKLETLGNNTMEILEK